MAKVNIISDVRKPAMKWIDLRKKKPEPDSRVLVCDEYGYVDIEVAHSPDYMVVVLGYPKSNPPSFEDLWHNGNGTRLVAWMPLPDWPVKLCHEDADGQMP